MQVYSYSFAMLKCDCDEGNKSLELAKKAKQSFSDSMTKLFKSKQFSDVVLKVSRKKFLAHKLVLSVGSPVFAAMFRNNYEESNEEEVVISQIDAVVFEELLRFLYSGAVSSRYVLSKKLLAAADMVCFVLIQISLTVFCVISQIVQRYFAQSTVDS